MRQANFLWRRNAVAGRNASIRQPRLRAIGQPRRHARSGSISGYNLRLADDAIGGEVAALPTKPARRRAGA